MKRLHLLALASSTIVATTGALFACGGDDDNTVDLVVDGGNDATIDHAVADTGSPDTGTDTGAPDAAPDVDVLPPLDAGADADPTAIINAFGDEISGHLCDALTRCCYGNDNVADGGVVDGGGTAGSHFDRGACVSAYNDLGFDLSARGAQGSRLDGVNIDETARSDCYAKIAAMSCTNNYNDIKAIRTSCFAALVGTHALGDTCVSTLQCVSGTFCHLEPTGSADGGSGSFCRALRTTGQPCGDVEVTATIGRDSIGGELACSNRGSGDTGNACQSYDLTTGNYTDRSTWTCQPALANGQICNDDDSCSAGLCNQSTFQCQATYGFFAPDSCQVFVTP